VLGLLTRSFRVNAHTYARRGRKGFNVSRVVLVLKHHPASTHSVPSGIRDAGGAPPLPAARGLHSFTFQLNVSAFCGIRGVHGVFRGYLWRGWRGRLGV